MATGYTPIYRIMKDGTDFTDRFNDRCLSITVELTSGGDAGDLAEIVLDDRDWKIAFPNVGDSLEIFLGYQEVGLARMGSFVVDEVEFAGPPRCITIHANSIGMASSVMVPQIESFAEETLGGVLRKIGEATGLSVAVHPELAAKAIPFLNQTTSGLHLIDTLARNFGAIAKIAEQTLTFVPRDQGLSVSGFVAPILQLGPEHFGRWSGRFNDRAAYSGVKASYWDKEDHVRKWVSQERFGPAAGSDDRPFAIGRLFNSEAEATAAAAAQMGAIQRAGGRLRANLAKGDPWIRDQQRLLVAGMRDGVDGSFTIESATHTFEQGGLLTSIEAVSTGTGLDFSALGEETFTPPAGSLLGELLKGPSGRVAGPV